MSEPKRYMVHRTVQVPCGCVQDELIDCESSNPRCRTLVDYADYARLKAEVDRLSKPAIIGGYNISEYIRMANSETLEFDNGDMFADMTLPERIKYIVESHARLKAEVERLTAFTTRTIIPNEELQAQVERLTKELENTDCMFAMASAFARDWQAAKEGKQS